MGPFLEQLLSLSPYLVAALSCGVVAAVLLRGARDIPGRLDFGAAALAGLSWNVLNFLEDGATDWAAKITLGNLQYFFIGAVSVLFFQFTVRFLGLGRSKRRGIGRAVKSLLWIAPLTAAALCWNDPAWGLVRVGLADGDPGEAVVLTYGYGPVFWALWLQCLLLLGTSRSLWIRWFWQDSRPREITFLALAGVVLPSVTVNVLGVFGTPPWPGHDATPVVIGLMGFPILWAVARRRFIYLLPHAREALMDAHREPVVVLDSRDRLASWNPAAADLGHHAGRPFPKPHSRRRPSHLSRHH